MTEGQMAKIHELSAQMKQSKARHKKLVGEHRQLANEVKNQHAMIFALDEKSQKLRSWIEK